MADRLIAIDTTEDPGDQLPMYVRDEIAVLIDTADISPSEAWIARHPGSHPVPASRVTYYTKPNTAYVDLPTTMDTGPATPVTYSAHASVIVDGGFELARTGTGTAFQYTNFDAGAGNELTRLAYTFKLNDTDATTDGWAMGMALSNGPELNYGGVAYRIGMHLTVGLDAWALSKVSNATGTLVFTYLATGLMLSPLTADNNAEYTVEAWRQGDTITLLLPDGEHVTVTDSDVGDWATRYGYIEITVQDIVTDIMPAFTEAWFDINEQNPPGSGAPITRGDLDANTSPKIASILGAEGNPVLRIADEVDAVNRFFMSSRVAGSPPYMGVEGDDAVIPFPVLTKGGAPMTVNNIDVALVDGTIALADEATALATARSIDGVPFDGTIDIGTGIWTPANSGLIAWSMDPMSCYIAGGVLSAGFLYLQAVIIPKAGNVTNVIIDIATAGASLTSGQNHAFLYQGGVRLGMTADQATAWQTVGAKVMALAGGPVAAAAGLAYVGVVPNGTTPPALLAPIAAANAATIPVTNMNAYRSAYDSHTGLTTTGPATLGTLTDTTPFWAAVS